MESLDYSQLLMVYVHNNTMRHVDLTVLGWENRLVDAIIEDKMTANEPQLPAVVVGNRSYGKRRMSNLPGER